jgi:glycerol-3-phosphate O-acyltransferase
LARIERVAHGPPLKTPQRMRDDTLHDAALVHDLQAIAVKENKPLAVIEKRARKLYDEIASRFDLDISRLADRLLKLVWARIYDGIHVDADEMRMVREAGRRGPLVIVPSHRSHVDYLVMSQVMMDGGMLPPFIAAGVNLSFFPLGWLFRRGGAYFIRRSFKGDATYASVFKTYVRRLFKEGFTQEFFIEGTRSRTGKTLPPKLGMVGMLVDAWLDDPKDDAIFIPAHISYERIVEAQSYAGELSGKDKQKESAAGLVKTAGVLARRYGRVFVTFDQPISLRELAQRKSVVHDASAPDVLTDEQRKSLVQSLANRIVYGINRAAVVTATHLVITSIFGHRRRGLDEHRLLESAGNVVAHLDRLPRGAVRFEPGLRDSAATLDEGLRAALAKLVADGSVKRAEADGRVLYRVDESAWLALDYFKNGLLHHLVPEAIVATALRALDVKPGVPVARADVAARARDISRALKIEFIFRGGVTFESLFHEAVANAVNIGFLREDGETLAIPDVPAAINAAHFAANLIANFIESYLTCARALPQVSSKPVDEKALVLMLLEALKGAALAGEVQCPDAVSKAIVENAVRLFREMQLVVPDGVTSDGKPTNTLKFDATREDVRMQLIVLLDAAAPAQL